MQKKLVATCLVNFLIAALLGLMLRYAFINPIKINYSFLTHTHSHVAMLGWVYLMLYTLFVHYFTSQDHRFYNRLFWMTQVSIVGMLFSFPFQGYAAISITFSTLHILCSYVFAFKIWRNLKTDNPLVEKMIKWSLFFMVLSTLGVWCLGPAVGLFGKTSAFYQLAIQFFLHFQFNGWFLFAVLAIFFQQLNVLPTQTSKFFLSIMIVATFCTYSLPVQWFAPHWVLQYINVIGSVLQLIALFSFIIIIKDNFKKKIGQKSRLLHLLYLFSISFFILKLGIQIITVLPELSRTLINHKNFVIGFIHLMMLGVISGFLFAFLLYTNTIKITKMIKLGICSFILGFLLTELLLIVQGGLYYFGSGTIPNYYLLLFVCSIFLPLGIALILSNYLTPFHHGQQSIKTT